MGGEGSSLAAAFDTALRRPRWAVDETVAIRSLEPNGGPRGSCIWSLVEGRRMRVDFAKAMDREGGGGGVGLAVDGAEEDVAVILRPSSGENDTSIFTSALSSSTSLLMNTPLGPLERPLAPTVRLTPSSIPGPSPKVVLIFRPFNALILSRSRSRFSCSGSMVSSSSEEGSEQWCRDRMGSTRVRRVDLTSFWRSERGARWVELGSLRWAYASREVDARV